MSKHIPALVIDPFDDEAANVQYRLLEAVSTTAVIPVPRRNDNHAWALRVLDTLGPVEGPIAGTPPASARVQVRTWS